MDRFPLAPPDLNFRCVGCGKCCDAPPQLSVREAFDLLDDFPIVASVIAMRTDVELPGMEGRLAMESVQRAIDLGGFIVEAETHGGRTVRLVVTVSAVALGPSSTGRCPALGADGGCTIYERRPTVCRYVPAQHLAAAHDQTLAVGAFLSLHAKDCDWSETAPPFLREGMLVDEEMTVAFVQAELDEENSGELVDALLNRSAGMAAGGIAMSFADFVDSAATSPDGEARVPFVILAMMMHGLETTGDLPVDFGGMSREAVLDLARRQATACRSMVESNIRRGDRGDRRFTAELRKLEEINLIAMEWPEPAGSA